MLGPSWAVLNSSRRLRQPEKRYTKPCNAFGGHVTPCWAMLGQFWAPVGARRDPQTPKENLRNIYLKWPPFLVVDFTRVHGHVGVMLGRCWAHVGAIGISKRLAACRNLVADLPRSFARSPWGGRTPKDSRADCTTTCRKAATDVQNQSQPPA